MCDNSVLICFAITKKNGDIVFSQAIRNKISGEIQEEWNGKWDKDTLTYSVKRGTDDIPGDRLERMAMSLALTTYAVEIPVKFRLVSSDENPDLRVEFRSKEEDEMFRKKPSTLAYAYFPSQGNISGLIVFNDSYHWSMNGASIDNVQTPNKGDRIKTYNLIHVMIHELGHSLGLRHDTNNRTEDVMDPYYNGKVLDLSENDIMRIRKKYGVRTFKHWSRYERLKHWLYRRKRRF